MKAKDLMIGDWVYSVFSEHPCIVEGIEWNESEYAFVKISGVDGYKCIESLLPIPLTPEILEKNGFEDWDEWSIYSPENTGIEIAWLGTILKIGGECGNFELPAIEYVHQLQHALRLCGIEKEIIL